MSLKRQYLKALGLSEEVIEQIIEGHNETVSELKKQLASMSEKATQLEEVTKQRDELQKLVDSDASADKIKSLEKQVQDFKDKEVFSIKKAALTKLLESSGIDKRGHAKVLAATDFSGFEVEPDGSIKDSDKLTEKLQTEWADLRVTDSTETAKPETPPDTQQQSFKMEDIKGMTPQEINQNWDAIKATLKGE